MKGNSKKVQLNSKTIATLSVLVAMSLITFILENLLPPLFLPGAKLGLSNIFTLMTLFMFGPVSAILLIVIRTTLGSLIVGNLASLIYSLSGGLVSLIVAIILVEFVYPRISLISVSIASAIVHNIVQVLVFSLVVENTYMISYLPYFALIGILSGLVVGMLVYLVIHKIPTSFFERVLNYEKNIKEELI